MSQVLTERTSSGVLIVTLNRPDELNTITDEMRAHFHAVMDEAEVDKRVRVVAITGAGRAFCAGIDLTGAGARVPRPDDPPPAPGVLGKVSWMHEFHRDWAGSVYHLSKPTVALVNGACAGGGFGMGLAADFRIASEDAFFVSAFATIALPGDNGVTYGLHRLVGRSKALELLMLSPRITAAEALDLGLVRQVVPADQLMSSGLEFCDRLAAGPPTVLALMKANMAYVETANYQEGLDRESVGIAIAGTTSESSEAVAAFLAKRRPVFP